jgi:hypothetical protein
LGIWSARYSRMAGILQIQGALLSDEFDFAIDYV